MMNTCHAGLDAVVQMAKFTQKPSYIRSSVYNPGMGVCGKWGEV